MKIKLEMQKNGFTFLRSRFLFPSPFGEGLGVRSYLFFSTQTRAFTNASTHGVIWSLFLRSAG